MKETSYWDKFMHSGRVEDYLDFKSSVEGEKQDRARTEASEEEQDSKKGDYPHAGFCDGNGNRVKGDAYR